jgi:excisionase family DNA binding protein
MGKLIGTVRAAELLKCARSYVGYLIYTRQLKATRPSRAYLLDEDDVLAFKATRRQSKRGRWVSSLQRPELDRVRQCFDENKHLLDKRAVKMLVQHFGLDGRPPMTLAEIGKRQKPPLTRARVGQIINRALARIGAR